MQLPNNRVLFIIKLILTSIIAAYIYRWWFGDYKLWWDDKMWTQKNIDSFIHDNFLKAIFCFSCVWAAYYLLIGKLFKNTVIRNAIKLSKKSTYELVILYIKKHVPATINFTKRIVGKRKAEDLIDDYNDFLDSLSKDIAFIFQVLTVWILLFGVSALFIISFSVVSIIAIALLLFTPITEKTFRDLTDNIKQQLNEENKPT